MIIALPKGIVIGRSRALVARICGGDPAPAGRLSFRSPNGDIVLLCKHRDVPRLLAANAIDIGITSYEWVVEAGFPQSRIFRRLDWCDTRISLIARAERAATVLEQPALACATEFPTIAKRYLDETGLASKTSLMAVSGSTETFVGSLCDIAIECVETGATLRDNGLAEVRTVLECHVLAAHSERGSDHVKRFNELVDGGKQ